MQNVPKLKASRPPSPLGTQDTEAAGHPGWLVRGTRAWARGRACACARLRGLAGKPVMGVGLTSAASGAASGAAGFCAPAQPGRAKRCRGGNRSPTSGLFRLPDRPCDASPLQPKVSVADVTRGHAGPVTSVI